MMKYTIRFTRQSQRAQQGVALIVALFVLAILSIISLSIFIEAQGELKRSTTARNSEKALKLAETGVQIARAMLDEGGIEGSLSSVDGYAMGGYFFTSMGSGMPGNEKWEQWHYDSGITGNNVQSEITVPLRPVWMKESDGRNGIMVGSAVTVTNLYAVVAGGAYFQIEEDTETKIRAVDEFTGASGSTDTPLKYDADGVFTWEGDTNGDKTILENTPSNVGYNNNYAINMSPMGSYANFSTVPDKTDPVIVQQTLYYSYAGYDGTGSSPTASTDTTSTVRLQAVNSLCNASPTTKANVLWEFDTGIHGNGTAPAVFDPSPDQPGDEIIYFAVLGQGDTNIRSRTEVQNQPNTVDDEPDKIYIYAIVDETSSHADNASTTECNKQGRYFLKWAHPFPDPDVADWTDYPTEEATGTNGQFPPYTRIPSDMSPFLPEDDIMYDYRDSFYSDGMQNQVRGNEYTGYFQPASISPVVVNVFYELDGVNPDGTQMVATQRVDTIEGVSMQDLADTLAYGDPADPLIEIYLVSVAHPTVKQDDSKSLGYSESDTRDWDANYDLKKNSRVQTRVVALRDRLDGSCDSDSNSSNGLDGEDCAWNWNSAKSRFPIFKWNYRVPSLDPSRSDPRPWNGYGEFVWDTWFEQQIAPMVGVVVADQDDTLWGSISNYAGGKRELYSALYVTYESLSFPDEGGDSSLSGPRTSDGSPVAFNSDNWWDAHLMVMGLRDTWDDYMAGNQTNPMWDAMVTNPASDPTPLNPYAIPVKSSPVEDYWTHKHDGTICNANGSMIAETYDDVTGGEVIITYPGSSTHNLAVANADKVGFARPYIWNEWLWERNVDNGPSNGHPDRDLDEQGWAQSGLSSSNTAKDTDAEGETSAMCGDCLDGDGLIVSVFNHDLSSYEDLRMHAINARSGKHAWDYHMPASLSGDYFNGTPAIANNNVFVSYVSRNGDKQGAFLKVLDASDGALKQSLWFDNESGNRADALIMSPSIANGAVYVGTYHFNGTNNQNNDSIRIYAFSPVLRLFSMGVYPMAYEDDTTIPDLTSQTADETAYMPRVERKLQVWITGSGSKWEEIRETRPVATPTP